LATFGQKNKNVGGVFMNQNNDREYFTYNGVKYGKGTKIELTEYAVNKFNLYLLENGNVVTFVDSICSQNLICCFTERFRYDKSNWINIPPNDIYIKRIIKEESVPIAKKSDLESAITNFKEKKKSPDIFYQCVAYACIMAALLIFVNGWVLMIIATFIFINWLVNQYKD
jgi:hypothetical protein